jgi:hypothetical protein
MSDFLKNFLQTDIRALAAKSPGKVYVAAFGKHPGWNDHIDNLGLETKTLVVADQLIYLEGIASQIDAGVWDRLGEGSLYPAFGHLLLWHRPGEAIIGVIASSRDGKGRTRYPLIVCAHVVGLPIERVVREVGPVVEAAMKECRSVETAGAVRAILERARQQLAEVIGRHPAGGPGQAEPRPLGGAGPSEGQLRILYEIKNKLAAWAPVRSGAKESAARERGVHMRLDPHGGSVAEALLYWTTFLHSQLDGSAPLLFMSPLDAGWVDVIVGKPAAADFFVLKAGIKAVPMVSSVPYEMGDAFRSSARNVFGEISKGTSSELTIFGPRVNSGPSGMGVGGAAFWKQPWQRLRASWGKGGSG